jgi:hypothetical protein
MTNKPWAVDAARSKLKVAFAAFVSLWTIISTLSADIKFARVEIKFA